MSTSNTITHLQTWKKHNKRNRRDKEEWNGRNAKWNRSKFIEIQQSKLPWKNINTRSDWPEPARTRPGRHIARTRTGTGESAKPISRPDNLHSDWHQWVRQWLTDSWLSVITTHTILDPYQLSGSLFQSQHHQYSSVLGLRPISVFVSSFYKWLSRNHSTMTHIH